MIGVDIGGSHISSVHFDAKFINALNDTIISNYVSITGSTQETILDEWTSNIRASIQSKINFDGKIAIAFPGPFDYQKGIIESHPNGKFGPLTNLNLKEALLDRLPESCDIHFQNDATCFGLGEYFYGNYDHSRILALTLGSGIGSAFIESGIPIRKSNRVPDGGEVYYLPYRDAKADDYFSTRWFVQKAKTKGLNIKGVKELVESKNRKIIVDIFDEFAHNFIHFFSKIALDFNATMIVIGGNISLAWKHFGNQLIKNFEQKNIQIIQSQLGEKAICLGAARSMHDTLDL